MRARVTPGPFLLSWIVVSFFGMKSLFDVGFRGNFHPYRMGQWESLISAIPSLIKTGVDVYQAREAEKAAEKAREKAEEAAAAAKARLEAEKAAQAKAMEEQAIAAATGEEKILGLSPTTAILGGVGILALIGIIAVVK